MHSTAGSAHDETVRLHSQLLYYTKPIGDSQKENGILCDFFCPVVKKSCRSVGGENLLSNHLASTQRVISVVRWGGWILPKLVIYGVSGDWAGFLPGQ